MTKQVFTDFYLANVGKKHLAWASKLTREGKISPVNRKPFRRDRPANRDIWMDEDGAYHSNRFTSFHSNKCEPHRCVCGGERYSPDQDPRS